MLKMGCRFCDIISNGKREFIQQSANTITILSDPYLLKGHCLVISKKHYESILEIPDEVLIELIKEVKNVEKSLLIAPRNPHPLGCGDLIITLIRASKKQSLLDNQIRVIKETTHFSVWRMSWKFGAFGCDIRQNYRPFQKESNLKVNHLHFHVIPRELEDELYQKSMIYEKEVFKPLTDEIREEVKNKLT